MSSDPDNRPPRIVVCLGVNCDANDGARALYDHLEALLAAADPFDPPFELRAANCLDMCEHGPNLVIHPGNRRHNYVDAARLDDILAKEIF